MAPNNQQLDNVLEGIPHNYRARAKAYAEHVATSRHYPFKRLVSHIVELVQTEIVGAGSGGLVGLLAGDAVEGVKLGAILGAVSYGVPLFYGSLLNFSHAWRALDAYQKRVLETLSDISVPISYAHSLSSGMMAICVRTVFLGTVGKLVFGDWKAFIVAALYSTLQLATEAVRGERLIARIEKFEAPVT